jgi:hypothetical protein
MQLMSGSLKIGNVDGSSWIRNQRQACHWMRWDWTFIAAKGWQIGSGPTEATCKTLTARLKGSGMRWDASNAEALMALEALRESGLWSAYWQIHLPKAA